MKKKLNLSALKVQSFVTTLDPISNGKLNGGAESIAACTVANSVKNGCDVSDYVHSLCRTCGIVCEQTA